MLHGPDCPSSYKMGHRIDLSYGGSRDSGDCCSDRQRHQSAAPDSLAGSSFPGECGSFPPLNTYGTFYGECSSLTFLQPLCCQRISYSSSLHEGYDEPEILLDQIVKAVPKALTLDILVRKKCCFLSRDCLACRLTQLSFNLGK